MDPIVKEACFGAYSLLGQIQRHWKQIIENVGTDQWKPKKVLSPKSALE